MDSSADAMLLGALEGALAGARKAGDTRSPLDVLADAVVGMGGTSRKQGSRRVTAADRDAWIRRLRSAQRGASTIVAYRNTIDDLLAWAARSDREDLLFEEASMVDYLDDYKRRCDPAPATYHRRFVLLRRFMRWLSHRDGLPDPFCDLHAPAKPREEADWLTPEEFAALLEAAGRPQRRRPGIVERDRLVLLALVTTALRRSELLALDWRDVDLDAECPSLLVRRGKGSKPRRQPLSPALARELAALRPAVDPAPGDPVFCGLAGKRLQPTILANIIRRSAQRAGLNKHVTAHTLRHTAATWLRQQTGDARLVAEFLGHADLSTVSRYAHVADTELHNAAAAIDQRAAPTAPSARRFTRRPRPTPAGEQLQLVP
jgi:integrase/recombinase XerC